MAQRIFGGRASASYQKKGSSGGALSEAMGEIPTKIKKFFKNMTIDSISNLLTRLRNAVNIKKSLVSLPYTKCDSLHYELELKC